MEGAFRCLVESGDIAFVKHSTPREVLAAGARKDVGVRVAGQKAITSTAIPREWGGGLRGRRVCPGVVG